MMKPTSMPQAIPRSIFGSCTDPSNPSFIDLLLPSASLSWGCSGHAQMHYFNFCFLKDSENLRKGKYPTSTSNTQAACSSVQ